MPPRKMTALAGHELDNDDERLSDTDLGIGEDSAPMADPTVAKIDAAMADPVIASAIEQLVQQRVAEMSGKPSGGVMLPPNGDFMAGMTALGKMIADSINKSTAATVEQMPGHVKPLPVEEIEAREAAYIEMNALLRDTTTKYLSFQDEGDMIEAERQAPTYLLTEDFFASDDIWLAGDTIRWFGPPGCHMEPRNAIAKKVSEAMWRYIGGQRGPSAEDLAAQASSMRRPGASGLNNGTPEMTQPGIGRHTTNPLSASRLDVPRVEIGPDRINGTVVQELKGGFGREPRIVGGPPAHASAIGY